MLKPMLFDLLRKRPRKPVKLGKARRQARFVIPRLEALEDRCLLSTTVDMHAVLPDSVPAGITAGPDGNVWFTELGGNTLEVFNTQTNSFSTVLLPQEKSGPFGITTGPDGNIWFTELSGGIGVFNPKTTLFRQVPLPTATGGPLQITTGPDENLWFTEIAGNKIGVINPATLAITEYAVPSADSQLGGITAGPDGNLWFAESANDLIGSINPATHAISEYATPTANSQPTAITVGPDGNLWFTEYNTRQIGELNLSTHKITEFNLPAGQASPAFISAGPDGNLWFTQEGGRQLGEIDPTTHVITEIAIPAAGSDNGSGMNAGGIMALPGGSLWLTQPDRDWIGELVISPVITVNPTSQTIAAGQTVSFTAAATGMPPPAVQWEISTDGGNTFAPVTDGGSIATGGVFSGAQNGTLTITDPTTALDGSRFEAVFHNLDWTPLNVIDTKAISSVAALTVNPVLKITPTLPEGEVGVNYDQTLTIAGGTAPLSTLAISAFSDHGTGLTLGDISTDPVADTVTIDGTPTGAGSVTFSVNAADAAGAPLFMTYTVAVHPALSLTGSLPGGITGHYDGKVFWGLGVAPYTMTVSNFDGGTTGLTAPTFIDDGGYLVAPYFNRAGHLGFNAEAANPGTAAFTVTVRDAAGAVVTQNYSVSITGLSITPTLPDGSAGSNYAHTITIGDFSAPLTVLTVAVQGDADGLTFTPNLPAGNVIVTGTPAAGATVHFSVSAADSGGLTLSYDYEIKVAPALTIATPVLAATAGANYTATIPITGGTGSYPTITINNFDDGGTGLAVAALSSTASAVYISGKPSAPGTVTFSVSVTDSAGTVATANCSIAVNPPPSITQPTAHVAVGSSIYQTLAMTAGTQPYSALTITSWDPGSTGLSPDLEHIFNNISNGYLNLGGVPTDAGTARFTVSGSDAQGVQVSRTFTITVDGLGMTPSLPAGAATFNYDQTVAVSGGTMPLTALTVSNFAAGLTGLSPTAVTINLAAGTVRIHGTPSAAGTATVTVSATDTSGMTISKDFNLVIYPSLTLPEQLPVGEVFTPYSNSIFVTGGNQTSLIFQMSVTNFDPGTTGLTSQALFISGRAIAVTGTPKAAGTATFTVNFNDSSGATLSQTVSLLVVSPPTIVASFPLGTARTKYQQTIALAVTGGSGPVTLTFPNQFDTVNTGFTLADVNFSALAGTLTVSGTPTGPGTAELTVDATDAFGMHPITFPIVINPPLSASSSPSRMVGSTCQQTIAVNGGTAPYTVFAVKSFNPGTTGLAANAITVDAVAGMFTISGTSITAGTASLTIQVTDSAGAVLTQNFSITTAATIPTLTGPTTPVRSTGTPTIAWTDTGAVRYDLWVDDVTAKVSPVLRLQNLTSPSFTPTAFLANGHQYKAWIEGFNSAGETSGWSAARTFSVNLPAPPPVPVPASPSATTSETTPVISWSDTGAARYDLWIDDATAHVSQLIRQQNLTTASFTPTTPFAVGHQFNVWVRAFDSIGQTAGWSQLLTFTVLGPAPAIPTLTAPSGSSSSLPSFTWTGTGADHYDLWVNDITAHISQVIRRPNLLGSSTSYTTATPLVGGHQYTAWLAAFNGLGVSAGWSQPLTFVVAAAPSVPTLTGPTGSTSTATATITWNAPLLGAPAGYDLWVDDMTAGTSQAVRQQHLPAGPPSFTTGALNVGHQYQAWVRAFDALGQFSPWSAGETFTVGTPPAAPTWTGTPTKFTSSTPTLSWTAPTGAANYELWIADNTTSAWPLLDQTGLTTTSFNGFAPSLTAGHRYTAWVRAANSLNQASAWSSALNFTIVLAIPVLTGPVSPTNVTPTITWSEPTVGAVRYDLWIDDATANSTQVIRQKSLTGTSFTSGPLSHGHTYLVWVQAFDATGQSSGWQADPLMFTVT